MSKMKTTEIGETDNVIQHGSPENQEEIESAEYYEESNSEGDYDSDNEEEITQKAINTLHRFINFIKTFGEVIFTGVIFFTTAILFTLSAKFIKPEGDLKSAYFIYYLIYIAFSIGVIVLCIFLKLNTVSMNIFYKNLLANDGKYKNLTSKNKKIDKVCEAYKNSFIVSGDEDYHKTRANSDLYFGVETWLQDLNILPLQTFLKIIPGTFIGFGILGTFIGFSEGLTQINVIDGDMQSITTGVQLLLDGLRNAFNTSIVGVLASVYLNFFVIHPFLNRINTISKQLCDYLDSKFYVTEVDAMAILDENHNLKPFPVIMNDLMSTLETVASNINHLGNTVGSQVSQSIKSTMDETIEGIIREEINKLKEELVTIINTLSDCSAQLQAAPQNLKEASGIMKDASNISITSFQQQSQESISALTQTINENLNAKFESYLETLTEISEVMMKVNKALDKLPDNFQSVTDSIDSTAKKIVDNSETISHAFDVSTQTLAQTTEITSQIVQSYESQVSIIGNSADQIEKVINESNQVTKNSKELLDGYTTMDNHLASIFAEINSNTEKYSSIISQSLVDYFKHFQKATKDISKQFADAISQLSKEIDKLNTGR